MSEENYRKLIQLALQAYKEKNYAAARLIAHQAIQLCPEKDGAWLIMAACASIRIRLAYL